MPIVCEKDRLMSADISVRTAIRPPVTSLIVRKVDRHRLRSLPSDTNLTFVRLNPMSVTALNTATKAHAHIMVPYSSPT